MSVLYKADDGEWGYVYLICHLKIVINVETVFVQDKVLNNDSVKSFELIWSINVAE